MLDECLESLKSGNNENLISGFARHEDSSIYKIDENRVIVNSLDFITPVVDDPYIFGQVAAANSLSDVLVMGAKPLVAQNIVCFPVNCIPTSDLKAMLEGGNERINASGCVLSGGHSIEDNEPKYGLSVTGIMNFSDIRKSENIKDGDIIYLTKPIGTGVILTALRAGKVIEEEIRDVLDSMIELNFIPEAAKEKIVFATDVTGFGLATHALDMILGMQLALEFKYSQIPFFNRTLDFIMSVPGGTKRNQKGFKYKYTINCPRESEVKNLIFDPQTSGGILFTAREKDKSEIDKIFADCGRPLYHIGRVIRSESPQIIIS